MRPQIEILLVDDRLDGLIAMEAILSQPRYNLVKARSGAEAIQLCKLHNFALILMDVQMPEMDGFQTAQHLRKLEGTRITPIIFVTAINQDDKNIYKGYQSGAVDYIFKPIDDSILRCKVAVFVELYEKTRKLEEQSKLINEGAKNERYLRLAQLEVESLKRYQNLADSIPHAVWRSKPDGTMDYFNRVWTEYTGLSDQQSVGMGWQSAFEDEDLRHLLKTWMEHIGKKQDFELEVRIRNKNGDLRWHLVRVVAECRSSGEIIAWLGTCTDIHERKDTEQKLIDAQKIADSANSAKTNFLANMSHEIRTPLNSILGFTDLMMANDFDESDQRKNLSTIKKNSLVLLKIIDEILDISKVEVGRLEIDITETNLSTLLYDVHSLLEVQAQEKGISFTFKFTNLIPEFIHTDATRFRQILINIIGNSLKFTPNCGRVSVTVSWKPISNRSTEGILACEVNDTGIGISNEDMQGLFQPFVQVDNSKSRRFGGTGLGLALSLRLAKALQGDIRIEKSEEGKGSTFIVEIKAQLGAKTRFMKDMHNSETQPAKIAAPIHPKSLQDISVLVVDDSVDNRNLLNHFLRAAGAKVDFAVDGFEGVELALKNSYEVVLMDIQMPKLDGYAATAELRKMGYSKPIIALTAHALKQERENSLKAGCDDHLTKPIDQKTLVEQIQRFGRKSEPRPLSLQSPQGA